MTQQFDFSSIADLGTFWDGSSGASGWGGADRFNRYTPGSLADTGSNIDLLYQNLVGRNADPAGTKYWTDKLKYFAIFLLKR